MEKREDGFDSLSFPPPIFAVSPPTFSVRLACSKLSRVASSRSTRTSLSSRRARRAMSSGPIEANSAGRPSSWACPALFSALSPPPKISASMSAAAMVVFL